MPTYHVTWTERTQMRADIEAETPEQAVAMVREGECDYKCDTCELDGNVRVSLDGEEVHAEKA